MSDSENLRWEKIKVRVYGITKNQRQKDFERKRDKHAKSGWEVFEFENNTNSDSYAVLRRPLKEERNAEKQSKKRKFKPWSDLNWGGKIWRGCWVTCVLMFSLSIFASMFVSTEDQVKYDAVQAEEKFNKFIGSTLSEARLGSLAERERELLYFMEKNGIPKNLEKQFYNFLSQNIYTKNGDLKVSEVLGWGVNELKNNNGNFKNKYYNLDNLDGLFSGWDGSHHKLTKLIKRSLNDEESYKHIETRRRLVLYGKGAPYMIVGTCYSAKNGFGARIKKSVVVKANIYNGDILEVIQEN